MHVHSFHSDVNTIYYTDIQCQILVQTKLRELQGENSKAQDIGEPEKNTAMHIAILIVICRFFLPSIRSWSRTFQLYQNAFFPVVCIMFLACITLDSTFV